MGSCLFVVVDSSDIIDGLHSNHCCCGFVALSIWICWVVALGSRICCHGFGTFSSVEFAMDSCKLCGIAVPMGSAVDPIGTPIPHNLHESITKSTLLNVTKPWQQMGEPNAITQHIHIGNSLKSISPTSRPHMNISTVRRIQSTTHKNRHHQFDDSTSNSTRIHGTTSTKPYQQYTNPQPFY